MREAGCELLEETTGKAVMGVGAVAHALEHRQRVKRLRAWLGANEVEAVIPTDSPAANWSVCQATRDLQPRAMILHLAAPQLWAWAAWRVKKMLRLSDGVMCLLPFEPEWFETRGVRAWFVGHPVFSEPGRAAPPSSALQDAPLTLALLPGSRAAEVKKNWPLMLDVWNRIFQQVTGVRGVVVAADGARAEQIRTMTPGAEPAADGGDLSESLSLQIGRARDAMASATAGLVVSGTATLHAAAAGMPTVAVYRVNPLAWGAVGRWLMDTRTFALPNLIAEARGWPRVVPEFIPSFGDAKPLIDAVLPLLRDPAVRDEQRMGFERIRSLYEGVKFTQTAGQTVLAAADL